jgi:hypothetical protein
MEHTGRIRLTNNDASADEGERGRGVTFSSRAWQNPLRANEMAGGSATKNM